MEKPLKDLIREELTVDEQEIVRRILPRVKRFIGFTKEGKIIFMADASKLPRIYWILIYVLGKRLANLAELVDSPNASIKELSDALGFAENYTRAFLSELFERGLITRSDSGLYNVGLTKLEEIMRLLESKLEKTEQ